MESFWDRLFWGNTARDWSIVAAIIAGAFLLLWIFKSIIVSWLRKLSEKTTFTFDDFIADVIEKVIVPLLFFLTIYYSLGYLQLSTRAVKVLEITILVITIFYGIRFVSLLAGYWLNRHATKSNTDSSMAKQSRGLLVIIKIFAWILGIVFLIDNLGYDITAIITGLGIGGIAIALASQAILADLFSYFVILFDKPFEPGDFITVDDKMGTVEYVGVKTTRVRTLSGEQLILPNTNLTNSRVHNFKRMHERRVAFSFGIAYETPPEKIKEIPGIVKEIIETKTDTRFDRAHFKTLGNFSLDFEVVYFILSDNFNLYMDLQQSINLELLEQLNAMGVAFAYPTQTLFVANQQSNNPSDGPKI